MGESLRGDSTEGSHVKPSFGDAFPFLESSHTLEPPGACTRVTLAFLPTYGPRHGLYHTARVLTCSVPRHKFVWLRTSAKVGCLFRERLPIAFY